MESAGWIFWRNHAFGFSRNLAEAHRQRTGKKRTSEIYKKGQRRTAKLGSSKIENNPYYKTLSKNHGGYIAFAIGFWSWIWTRPASPIAPRAGHALTPAQVRCD